MDEKWTQIMAELSSLEPPSEDIEPLTFLPPAEWHIERHKGNEILVVAEETPKYSGSICLAVDLSGKVCRATAPKYEVYHYCSNSYKQFLLIAKKYLEITCESQRHTMTESEQIENEFRNCIQQIDPTALSDENSMWSIYAEELGYGF